MKINLYRKRNIAVLIAMLLGVTLAHAKIEGQKKDSAMGAALVNYLKIQETLASDSTQGVGELAQAISVQAPKLKKVSLALAQEKEIKPMREHFKDLSSLMVLWAKVEKPAGVQIVTCSMANGSWLQKTGAVRNPYYGKGMLECGEIEK